METTLEQNIAALVTTYGPKAVQEALNKHVSVDSGTVPTCPTGYYWNGTSCVLNVG
jgi:hypothetical protein